MQIQAAMLRAVTWRIDYPKEPETKWVCVHVLALTVYVCV